MPHPDHLERYEVLMPGAAAIIFQEFQVQGAHRRQIEADRAAHRRDMEQQLLTGEQERANRGQKYALAIAVIALIAALVATLAGYPTVGAVIAGLDIVGLVAVFVTGKMRH